MTPSWLATLDAFEGHLDVQAVLIEDGLYDEVAAFAAPSDLPLLPRVLAARASDLLLRAQALTERARTLCDDTQRGLDRSRQLTVTQRPIPVYVDQQA